MTCLVYRRAEQKPRAVITPELRAEVLDALQQTSQQQVARRLGLSQATISRIAREAACSPGGRA